MTPSITFRAIQRASKAVADRGLRGAGFRRLGNHLHRHVDGLIHAVHFQASPWGSATAGSFTVNLAVTSPFVYSTWAGGPLPSNPATALFPVMERIGLLMPSGRDQWWDVDGSTDLDALAREVADAVLRHGLPFFEPFRSSDSMLSRLRAGQGLPGLAGLQLHLVHAMLAAEAGDRREAQALLQGALATAGAPPFCEIVRVIGARLGIACD